MSPVEPARRFGNGSFSWSLNDVWRLNAKPAQVQSGDDGSQPGTGEDIEHDMLADGDRGIDNAQTPQSVERAHGFSGVHLPQQAAKPESGEYRKSHMQGGAGVARGVHRLEKRKRRMLLPVGVGPGYGRRPQQEYAQPDEADGGGGQGIGPEFAAINQQCGHE